MLSLPGGVVIEEEGHSGWLAIGFGNDYSELGILRETVSDQVLFCSANRTGFSLIFC